MSSRRAVPVRRWTVAGLAVTGLVLAGCTGPHRPSDPPDERATAGVQVLPEFDAAHAQELLGGTWQYLPGAVPRRDGLAIHHTGEAILTNPNRGHAPANPQYVPDPPVNVYGTRLEVTNGSDVGIAAHVSDIHGAVTVSFRAQPPIRYDERIEYRPGVDVTVDGTHATVSVHGDAGSEQRSASLDRTSSAQADVTVAQEGSQVVVVVDGHRTTLDAKPFTGQVWFGMDTTGSFALTALRAYPVHGSHVAALDMSHYYDDVSTAADGLASLATRHHPGTLIGTAVDLGALMADPELATFYLRNVNEFETEMLAKFQALQPEQGQYEFAELDALVDLAGKHHVTVHGHALVFGEAYPRWLRDTLATASSDQARALLKSYITTVMTRYDGKHGHGLIRFWDVVNEPFDQDNLGRLNEDNIWYEPDPNYIIDALGYALSARPDAVVAVNENSMEGANGQWAGMRELMGRIKAAGLDVSRIQIGFQCHYDEATLADPDDMDVLYSGELATRFQAVKGMGFFGARVSEASVALSHDGGTSDDPARQADIYRRLYGVSDDVDLWGAASSPYYFTTERAGDGTLHIGNDAPAYQEDSGTIVPRPAWSALRTAAAG